MREEWQSELNELIGRCFKLDDDCFGLGYETVNRFAIRETNGSREWIEFADGKDKAFQRASDCVTDEVPWAAVEIVDLATGERWEVASYTARILPVTAAVAR